MQAFLLSQPFPNGRSVRQQPGWPPYARAGREPKKLDVQLVHCRPRTAARRCSSLVRQQPRRRVGRKSSCAGAQGEDQKKLDVVSNEVFCNALRNSGRTGIIASEEEDLPVSVEETYSGVALPCPNPTLVHPPGPACFRASRCAGDRSLLGRNSVCDRAACACGVRLGVPACAQAGDAGWARAGNYVVVFDPLDGSSNIDAGISTGSIFGIYAPSEECAIEVPACTLVPGTLDPIRVPRLVCKRSESL